MALRFGEDALCEWRQLTAKHNLQITRLGREKDKYVRQQETHNHRVWTASGNDDIKKFAVKTSSFSQDANLHCHFPVPAAPDVIRRPSFWHNVSRCASEAYCVDFTFTSSNCNRCRVLDSFAKGKKIFVIRGCENFGAPNMLSVSEKSDQARPAPVILNVDSRTCDTLCDCSNPAWGHYMRGCLLTGNALIRLAGIDSPCNVSTKSTRSLPFKGWNRVMTKRQPSVSCAGPPKEIDFRPYSDARRKAADAIFWWTKAKESGIDPLVWHDVQVMVVFASLFRETLSQGVSSVGSKGDDEEMLVFYERKPWEKRSMQIGLSELRDRLSHHATSLGLGFKSFFPSVSSIDEQVQAARSACIVFTGIGSGEYVSAFMQPGSVLIAVHPTNYNQNEITRGVALSRGLFYIQLIAYQGFPLAYRADPNKAVKNAIGQMRGVEPEELDSVFRELRDRRGSLRCRKKIDDHIRATQKRADISRGASTFTRGNITVILPEKDGQKGQHNGGMEIGLHGRHHLDSCIGLMESIKVGGSISETSISGWIKRKCAFAQYCYNFEMPAEECHACRVIDRFSVGGFTYISKKCTRNERGHAASAASRQPVNLILSHKAGPASGKTFQNSSLLDWSDFQRTFMRPIELFLLNGKMMVCDIFSLETRGRGTSRTAAFDQRWHLLKSSCSTPARNAIYIDEIVSNSSWASPFLYPKALLNAALVVTQHDGPPRRMSFLYSSDFIKNFDELDSIASASSHVSGLLYLPISENQLQRNATASMHLRQSSIVLFFSKYIDPSLVFALEATTAIVTYHPTHMQPNVSLRSAILARNVCLIESTHGSSSAEIYRGSEAAIREKMKIRNNRFPASEFKKLLDYALECG